MGKFMELGAFEAKTHFSELIEAARGGTEIIVTRRGKPVARIVSVGDGCDERAGLLKEFDAIRAGARPGPSVRELREERRR
ncbi:MAG: type II toxin-antitoxin system prevent-host-death family antitoxin [Treponemataceae bacterium]